MAIFINANVFKKVKEHLLPLFHALPLNTRTKLCVGETKAIYVTNFTCERWVVHWKFRYK